MQAIAHRPSSIIHHPHKVLFSLRAIGRLTKKKYRLFFLFLFFFEKERKTNKPAKPPTTTIRHPTIPFLSVLMARSLRHHRHLRRLLPKTCLVAATSTPFLPPAVPSCSAAPRFESAGGTHTAPVCPRMRAYGGSMGREGRGGERGHVLQKRVDRQGVRGGRGGARGSGRSGADSCL